MNILIFIHSMSAGGAERVTATLANHWALAGHKITIVTVDTVETDFYKLHSSVSRRSLDLACNSFSTISGLWNNMKRIVALRKVLVGVKPDIALAMMTTANCLLALASVGTDIPTVGSERIHPPAMPLGSLWEFVRKNSYAHLNAVSALTKRSAKWLKENTKASKVVVIPNPVIFPLPKGVPLLDPCIKLDCSTKLLLAVGRLVHQKGFDRLIAIFSKLIVEFPDWCLAIVGEGPERSALEKQVMELNLKKKVFLPGRVGNIGDWYQAADLYVMTSRFEGFPNTLVEAMSYGLPAVSVDCDTGPRDIIRHGIDGFLVPQEDDESLVKNLAYLMRNEELRERFGQYAVDVKKRFSLERIAALWGKLFITVGKNGR